MAVVELQPELRAELKEPMGRLFADADDLLGIAGSPLIAVGDVVTAHLLRAGRIPHVALVDARTERSAVDEATARAIASAGFDREVSVRNPPAALTADLLSAVVAAVATEDRTLIDVDGEEDLATLPAVVAAPAGASVVYGQPGAGMVHVPVDDDAVATAQDLLDRMEGDTDRLRRLLAGEPDGDRSDRQ